MALCLHVLMQLWQLVQISHRMCLGAGGRLIKRVMKEVALSTTHRVLSCPMLRLKCAVKLYVHVTVLPCLTLSHGDMRRVRCRSTWERQSRWQQ